jgi:hypothetical protein
VNPHCQFHYRIKEADAVLLKPIIQFVSQHMVELDVEGLRGAGFDVKYQAGQTAATATAIASGKLAPME